MTPARAAGADPGKPGNPGDLVLTTDLGSGVHELTLNRPAAMNAVNSAMAGALARACAGLAEDPLLRCVIVTSAHPTAFCVGADLKERAGLTTDELLAQRPLARSAYRSVLDLPVPVVAAVEGFALGGGAEIALACDLIVASETASFALPEVGVGVIPGGGGTVLLPRKVGWSTAARLIFGAERIAAGTAAELGIVDELVPATTAREAALRRATRIARGSPLGLRMAKRSMIEGHGQPLDRALDVEDACWRVMAASNDRAEGVAAFVAKRPPEFTGT